jgi:hypothetical protein
MSSSSSSGPSPDLLPRRTACEDGTAGAGMQPPVLDHRPPPPAAALAGAVWQMVDARRLSCGNTYHGWHAPGNCRCGSAVWSVCVYCRHAAAPSRHLSSRDPDAAACLCQRAGGRRTSAIRAAKNAQALLTDKNQAFQFSPAWNRTFLERLREDYAIRSPIRHPRPSPS